MLVCPEKKFVYLRPPRTGTTTCTRMLCSLFGLSYPKGHHFPWQEEYNNWFVFITVRHPHTRMFSLYRQATKWFAVAKRSREENAILFDGVTNCDEMTFEKWVLGSEKRNKFFREHSLASYYHTPPETRVGRCRIPLSRVDQVIRQESLNEGFNTLPFIDTPAKLKQRNGGRTKRWAAHYTPELVEAVAEIWKEDFELFGYDPEMPYEHIKSSRG